MTAPYDHEALWAKAKLFLNNAMDDDPARPFDEQALWASLALELLAKAALARINPLLIATPTEDGTNLLIASALVEGQANFTSIKAHTLFSRCAKAFKPFREADAKTITNARNDYLHGATPTFTTMPPHVWWPRYWAQASILVHALDQTLWDLVGARESLVERHLEANQKYLEERTQMLLAAAKQRLSLLASGGLPQRLSQDWSRPTSLEVGESYSVAQNCPVCDTEGKLEGEQETNRELKYDGVSVDDFFVWAELTIGADYFSCPNCRLVLDRYELLIEAGLPGEFDVVKEADYEEDDYGND